MAQAEIEHVQGPRVQGEGISSTERLSVERELYASLLYIPKAGIYVWSRGIGSGSQNAASTRQVGIYRGSSVLRVGIGLWGSSSIFLFI